MRSFQENFHPGDSVGYSYGLHHDTDNLHAHVFIHPRTRQGEFVGMSEQLQRLASRGAASRHKNQLRFVREAAGRRAAQVIREIPDPKQTAHLKNNFHSDRIHFLPRQSHTARTKNDFRPRKPADYQLEEKRSALAVMRKKIADKRLELQEATGGRNIVAILRLRQPKWIRLLEQAQSAKLFRELRELQVQRHRLWTEYRAARRRLIPDPRATKTVPAHKKTEPSASALKPSPLKPAIKPTVTVRPKSKKSRLHF